MATSDLANELAKETFRFDNPTAEKQASGGMPIVNCGRLPASCSLTGT